MSTEERGTDLLIRELCLAILDGVATSGSGRQNLGLTGLGRHFAIPAEDSHQLERSTECQVISYLERIEEEWERPWLADTDKTWRPLHHSLLAGPAPLSYAVLGGRPLTNGRRYLTRLVTPEQVREAAAALATEPVHCVVLELDLPGGEALRFLEHMDGDTALATLPVLAHNNRRLDVAQERALQRRAEVRPLELLSSLDELRERIALHLSAEQPGDVLPLVRPEEALPQTAEPVDRNLAGRTVLVVDDDARNLYALSGILELHGIHVLHAENGRRGIDALTRHPRIDLILMDVMMPEMDGYTATAEIRRMPAYAELPIIAVTAKAMPGDREKSLASGASDYVTKPVDANDLIDCVRRWLTADPLGTL